MGKLQETVVETVPRQSSLLTESHRLQNGSLFIATLQPRFTILHNLTTARAPSPIVTLAWHASSSRQKSDMLAVQTHDGDLRVWSVTKSYSADDPPKAVRVLQRKKDFIAGPNWMGWSKNGRIIQFSDSYVQHPWPKPLCLHFAHLTLLTCISVKANSFLGCADQICHI